MERLSLSDKISTTYTRIFRQRENQTYAPSSLSALRKHANDPFTTRSNLGPRQIKGIITITHKLSTVGVKIKLGMSAFSLFSDEQFYLESNDNTFVKLNLETLNLLATSTVNFHVPHRTAVVWESYRGTIGVLCFIFDIPKTSLNAIVHKLKAEAVNVTPVVDVGVYRVHLSYVSTVVFSKENRRDGNI